MLEDHLFCPSCNEETPHSAIKSGQKHLARCYQCGTAHATSTVRAKLASLKVIVNRGGAAEKYQIALPARDILKVGDELLVDDPAKDVVLAEITALESDRRVQELAAGEARTVWARAVDRVVLKASVYRKGISVSLKTPASGDEVIQVGDRMEIDGVPFKITKIKLRGEGFADTAEAKEVKRLWGRAL